MCDVGGDALAFVPEPKRHQVRARIDAIESRRGGSNGPAQGRQPGQLRPGDTRQDVSSDRREEAGCGEETCRDVSELSRGAKMVFSLTINTEVDGFGQCGLLRRPIFHVASIFDI